MRRVALPLLLATGITVANANSRTGFSGKDALSVSQPIVQHAEQMQSHQEFWKWQKKKEKEEALKFLMPEATTITSSSKTLTADQQKEFEKAKSNLVFIENKGQWHSDVLYLCRIGGLDAWITKYGVNYTFYKLEEIPSANRNERSLPDKFKHKDYNMIGHRVLMKLQNYNLNPAREGKQKQEGYYNYFIGNDPSKHASYVGLYKEVVVKDVYNGIDLRYYFDKGSLRYDYVVHPGADPSQIIFTLEGSENIYVNHKGNLLFTTRFGEVALAELKTYQEKDKKEIKSRFIQKENGWGIALAPYDHTQTLIIDPLIYSTYIGGSDLTEVNDLVVDNNGFAYITGYTNSTDYDTTAGAFQTTYGGGWSDIIVTKLNTSGTGLVYSTFLGGYYFNVNLGDDRGYGIAVDNSGQVFVTGITYSTNFPVTTGVIQSNYIDGGDVFVTKLNASGTALIYSTYLGGSDIDAAFGIKIDSNGNAYIAGKTLSNNFPTTSGAFQTFMAGGGDVFVTKINPSGSAIIYSTYIGGSDYDVANDIAIDNSGNVFITGEARSFDYPVTSGAYQTIHEGVSGAGPDVFVTKLNASGSTLIYSTFIGGSLNDIGYGIDIDTAGNAYVTGGTFSSNFDTTAGAYQTTPGILGRDIFVTKLNPSGSVLIYSTLLGDIDDELSYDIAVDNNGSAYVTGFTSSSNFDITNDAFQSVYAGNKDVFVTKLNPSGTSIDYSSFIGGYGVDIGRAIALDNNGNIYIAGVTNLDDYDITPGAYQPINEGNQSGFVTKLCIGQMMNINLTSAPSTTNQNVCINSSISNITYTTTGASGANVIGLPGGVSDSYSGNTLTISGTPTVSGTFVYTVNLVGGCGDVSTTGTISVNDCVGIEELTNGTSWQIFPNPAPGIFTIISEKGGVFEIMDLTGRVLNVFRIETQREKVNTNLPTGIYFIREKASGKIQKLIVE